MKKKIYELELAFKEAFDNAFETVCYEPRTLREVLEYGFNNVEFDDKFGYEEEDFTEDELNTVVIAYEWDEDPDGFRFVKVNKAE